MNIWILIDEYGTYLMHLPTSTVFQNCKMPSISSSLECGFTSLRTNSFNSCHMFSSGFKSGDSGAVFHQFTLLASKNDVASPEVCFGSLSCINLWPKGNFWAINGNKVVSRILTYSMASIFPSKTQILEGPRKLMLAQTWTLTGCFGLQNV